MNRELRYENTGVDYATLDSAKRLALSQAGTTSPNALGRGATVVENSRGEPAVVVRLADLTLGFVLECLGTKSMLARAYEQESGIDRFDAIGYDTVASVVNDCCCVGALPFLVNAYFATGSSAWYAGSRYDSLVRGWTRACSDAGAAWGGGESPTLSGLVYEEEIDLAGSAIGRVPNGIEPLLGAALRDGDEIVLVASSGLHANGASLVRAVAAQLEEGLMTRLEGGRALGDAVLDSTVIYVRLVEALFRESLPVHYLSHITGHGLRKLMRAQYDFTYRIDVLPAVPEVLTFLVDAANMDATSAYGTFNMGAGFACIVAQDAGARVVEIAAANGYEAIVAGVVEHGVRRVVLQPVDVIFDGSELELR